MIFTLDTNTCIFLLNGNKPLLSKKVLSLSPECIAIPSIVKGELLLGALKSNAREKTITAVDAFLKPFITLPFADNESAIYARIRATLEKRGTIIGPNDLLIAAITLAHGATLITNNTKEFKRVDGLMIEDWTS